MESTARNRSVTRPDGLGGVRREQRNEEEKQGRRLDSHEILAQEIEVTKADDSYALEHSILKHEDLEYEENHWYNRGPFLWGMNVVAFLLSCLVVPYKRWAPCSHVREREAKWIKAGKMYRITWFDRVMRGLCNRVMKPISFRRWLCGPKKLNQLLGYIFDPLITDIREGVTTSQALDAVYAAKRKLTKEFQELRWYQWLYLPRVIGRALTLYVMCTPHPAGVRNRLRSLFKGWVFSAEESANDPNQNAFEQIELACGSSECMNHVHFWLQKNYPDFPSRQILVDTSGSSLRRAKRQAESLGVDDRMEYIPADMRTYLESLPNNSVKRMGAVGYLDYQTDKGLDWYLTTARQKLQVGGELVVSMILETPYDYMLENLIGWPLLLHRTVPEFLLAFWRNGWLHSELVTEEVEPMLTHVRLVFRKQNWALDPDVPRRSGGATDTVH